MLHNNNDYLLLLSKQFSGEITPEEAETLRAWRAESDENERYAREMRQVWEQSGAYDRPVPVNVEADFHALQARIRREDAKVEQPAGLRVSYVWRAAAAAAVVLLGIFVWQRGQGDAAAATAVFVAGDEKMQLDLPDGTRVWLRRGGRLEYPKYFTGPERRVSLQGEAYFDVTHNPQQPFVVSTPDGGKVEVLGTKFGIQPLDNGASVLVREGKVRYTPGSAANQGGALVSAGQKAVYNRNANQVKVTAVYSYNDIAWQSGNLEFVAAPMQTALEDLEKFYGVDLDLRNSDLRNCPVSARISSQNIDKVLEYMTLTFSLSVQKTANGRYVLSGGNCK